MHELSLCLNVIESIEACARTEDFDTVEVVRLEIGQLSGAEPEAMRLGFDVAARGTVVEGARLEVIEVSGKAWCPDCSTTVPLPRRFDGCPHCQAFPLAVTDGEQLRIRDLEVS